jgi:KDO2-lipid IV(A) lauroyltransferase
MRLLYPVAAWLAARLPRACAVALARTLASVVWALSPERRRAVAANLARVRPGSDRRALSAATRRTFANFAETLVDAWRADAHGTTIEGGDALRELLARGEGVLLWSAHLGNWELAAAALARAGFDVAALARAHADPGVERFFERRRARAGVRIVGRCPGARDARRLLQGHGLLALLGDRTFGEGGRSVTLFGRPATLPAAPLALARRTGARLVPGFVLRTGPGRYRIRFEPALPTAPEVALPLLARSLERWIRTDPEQWFVFERVWSERAADRP